MSSKEAAKQCAAAPKDDRVADVVMEEVEEVVMVEGEELVTVVVDDVVLEMIGVNDDDVGRSR